MPGAITHLQPPCPAEPPSSDPAGFGSARLDRTTLLNYDGRVPRYTSYPTAAQFHDGVGPAEAAAWLSQVPADQPVSLYLHVPFCHSLCWYCGCNTQVLRRAGPLAQYARELELEIDHIARRLPAGLPVSAVHWGGGTPTILEPDDLAAVMDRLRRHFTLLPGAEIATEIDPRSFDGRIADGLAAIGVTRVSLGVQDFEPAVQQAINRHQSVAQTAEAMALLRARGIASLNVDLIYGLPHQTPASMARTVEQVVALAPTRLAAFGYAHVPWMKKHQELIDESLLPDAAARLELLAVLSDRLVAAGYRRIGLDHFAAPDDALAQAAIAGRLRRNFQGYTTDTAQTVVAFGASAISALPGGFVQNQSRPGLYRSAIQADGLATARGVAVGPGDRLIADVIEQLMCGLTVDLSATARTHDTTAERAFALVPDRLAPLERDGILSWRGWRLSVHDDARILLRSVCAAFDHYLVPATGRHSRAL